MKKLNNLWQAFNNIKGELAQAHDPVTYQKKKDELLELYEQIQKIESEIQSWRTA